MIVVTARICAARFDVAQARRYLEEAKKVLREHCNVPTKARKKDHLATFVRLNKHVAEMFHKLRHAHKRLMEATMAAPCLTVQTNDVVLTMAVEAA